MNYTAKQIIRNINISILTDMDMYDDIKEIYNVYQKVYNNLHLGKTNIIKNYYQYVVLNDKGEVICMFSNNYTNLHICKRLINEIRIEIESNIHNEDVLYLLKYFIKEKFPNIIKSELDSIHVIKTNTNSLKKISDTIKIELV